MYLLSIDFPAEQQQASHGKIDMIRMVAIGTVTDPTTVGSRGIVSRGRGSRSRRPGRYAVAAAEDGGICCWDSTEIVVLLGLFCSEFVVVAVAVAVAVFASRSAATSKGTLVGGGE